MLGHADMFSFFEIIYNFELRMITDSLSQGLILYRGFKLLSKLTGTIMVDTLECR